MRKLLTLFFITICFCIQAQIVSHDKLPAKPERGRPVVDNADMLTNAEEALLIKKLVAYNDSTSNQIVIVTVKTLQGYEPDQYATEIGHYWGVGGQAKYDNGVVILVSNGAEEGGKKKIFIATGYGLEGSLPSITCKKIVDFEMKPSLKAGDYFKAFDKAIDAIIKAAAGEYKAPDGYKKSEKSSGSIFGIIIIVIIAILIFIFRNRGGGGGLLNSTGFMWFLPSILNSIGGNSGFGGGNSNDSGSSGFGDFGGGDFGGGGAGGDW